MFPSFLLGVFSGSILVFRGGIVQEPGSTSYQLPEISQSVHFTSSPSSKKEIRKTPVVFGIKKNHPEISPKRIELPIQNQLLKLKRKNLMRKIQHGSFTRRLGGFFKNDGAQKHVLNSPPGNSPVIRHLVTFHFLQSPGIL